MQTPDNTTSRAKLVGDRLRRLDECQRGGMLAKVLLDGVRMWPGRIRGNQGVDEFQKLIRGARWEAVHRMRHNVGMNVLSEMEANREAARTGILRVIVSNGGNSREIGEARRHRDG